MSEVNFLSICCSRCLCYRSSPLIGMFPPRDSRRQTGDFRISGVLAQSRRYTCRMPFKAYLARVGGFTVALGVGAAVMTGWHSGLAWADETDGTAGSTTSNTTTGTESKADAPGKITTLPKDDVETPTPTEAVEPSKTDTDETATTKPARKKGSDTPAPKPTKPKPPPTVPAASDAKRDGEAPAAATPPKAADSAVTDQTPPSVASLRIASTETSPAVTMTTQPPLKPLQANIVRAATALVSGVVNAVLSPFAASSVPGAPAEAPSIWSLVAFARREFERAFSAPSLNETPAATPQTSQTTEERTLILSAFPAETDAILARTTLDPNPSVVVDGHHFYLGTLGGKKVIVAMTGIGMVNATNTTETALDHFTPESGISIDAVVFSGVAGGSGRTEIGSVAVPARWTSDDGATWHAVDSGMLAAADTLTVDLDSTATLGDPLCLCSALTRLPLVDLNREPQLFVGGDGSSDDNNNGTAFPAIPLGGDIYGPQPCAAPDYSPLFTGNFFQHWCPSWPADSSAT